MGQAPFSFQTNLQGARAYFTSEGDIPTGAYVGVCTGWEYPVETKAKDAFMLVLDMTVQDGKLADVPENTGLSVGEVKGRTKKVYIIIPETCKNPANVVHAQGNLKGWLIAFGCNADAVNAGQIEINQGIFAGKGCTFWNIQNTETVNGNISALAPDQYKKILDGTMHGPTKGKARKPDGGGGGDESATLMPSGAQSSNPMSALGGTQAQAMTMPTQPVVVAQAPVIPASITPMPTQVAPVNGLGQGGAGTGLGQILQHSPRA